MASLQSQSANTDLFDLYFRRADLDRDGRISGLEAVTFFQGSGLSKQVLAKVWDYADQNRTGFLGRAEFYNALKLVTVAQSKRELTPDIVKAALYGPAAAKIPAPQINLGATPPSQPNTATPVSQVGAPGSVPSQNPGLKGAQTLELTNQRQFSSRGTSSMTAPRAISSHPTLPVQGPTNQGVPGGGATAGSHPSTSNVSANWVAGVGGTTPSGVTSQLSSGGVAPSGLDGFGPAVTGPKASLPPRPPGPSAAVPPRPPTKDPRQVVVSGNGFASDSVFGGDPFSVIQSEGRQRSSSVSQPVTSASSSGFASNQSSAPAAAGPLQPSQTLTGSNQQSSSRTSQINSFPGGVQNAGQPQMPWPKMTPTDIQKYLKVFVQVDTDRDGKISGQEARNLFLSWRLPREVLKQVWDLSDQDNDSMLSLREFCIALYLMERYREGRSLPAALPSSILSDLPTASQLMAGYSNTPWRHPSGLQQQAVSNSSSRLMTHAARGRPPLPTPPPPKDDILPTSQQKPKVPVLEKHLVDQLSEEEQSLLESKFQEATEADKKVGELEKEILESREKIEFCRARMQELVLYKSRCDNRLNEITERASADRREAEVLAKKYEEKYRQAGDVASKLTIEEATFRDIQEKKMEIYKAIVKLEHGRGDDPNLQAQADHIQSDLDELVKNLNERCKSYGLRGKPLSLVELPFGWQPGIQETAADWDGDWDKFDEEGFTIVKELTLDVENVIAPPKRKSSPADSEKVSTAEVSDSPKADVKSEKPVSTDETVVENGVQHSENEEHTSKSVPNSPVGSSMESPSRGLPDVYMEKKTNGIASPRTTELQSSSETGGSMLSNDKAFDESRGTFDGSENIDFAWDFNPIRTSKEKDKDDHQLGMEDFGLNPIKTGTSQASFLKRSSFFDESVPSTPLFDSGGFQKRNSVFDESVPSTPLYNTNYSPSYKGGSGPSFDSFSRFDSFRSNDGELFSQRETLARFDSMRSSKDLDYGFPSFDDSDPFGSGPFKTSFDSQTPRSDFDTFGNEPFKMSFDGQTPRRDFDGYGNQSFNMSFDSQTPRSDYDSFGNQSFKMSFDTQTPRGDFDSFANQSFKMSFDGQTPRRDSDLFGNEPFKMSFGSETPRSDYDSFGSRPFKTSFESQTPRKDSDHWGTF